MAVVTGPDWLGSPQHVIGGAGLALAVVVVSRWFGARAWLAGAVAIGAGSTAGPVIEIAEYPLLYSDKFHYSAYYDTVADMISTLVGGFIGIITGLLLASIWRPRWLTSTAG